MSELSCRFNSAYKLVTSDYKDLEGGPDVAQSRLQEFILSSSKCLHTVKSIASVLQSDQGSINNDGPSLAHPSLMTGIYGSLSVSDSFNKIYSVDVELFELCRAQPDLGNMLLRFPTIFLPLLEDSIRDAVAEIILSTDESKDTSNSAMDEKFRKVRSKLQNCRIYAR